MDYESAGDRLIDAAAKIAIERGDGHRLYDSILISVIRTMDAETIRNSCRPWAHKDVEEDAK